MHSQHITCCVLNLVFIWPLVLSPQRWWGQSCCCCRWLRGAGCCISYLLCLETGKVWRLHLLWDWLCWVTLAKIKPRTISTLLNLSYCDCVATGLRPGPGLDAASATVCLCCCSYLSLIMTYPSRVCLASSFLFSSRSSGTRRRSGGPQRPIMRVPHRQSLLPVRLRTPAPLNRNARWRSHPT